MSAMRTLSKMVVAPLALFALSGCQAAPAGEPPGAVAAAGPVDALPLEPGYYVRTDESCGDASAAGVHLVSRAGLRWVTSHCLFERIEHLGGSRYRVLQSCGDHHGAAEATALYEVPDRDSFSFRDDAGWEHAARRCPQEQLPEPWRSEDLRGLVD